MGNLSVEYIKLKVVLFTFASIDTYNSCLTTSAQILPNHKKITLLYTHADSGVLSIVIKTYSNIPNSFIRTLFTDYKHMTITYEFTMLVNAVIMPTISIPSNKSELIDDIYRKCKFSLRHLPTNTVLSDSYRHGNELRFLTKSHALQVLRQIKEDKYQYDLVYLPTNTSINIL